MINEEKIEEREHYHVYTEYVIKRKYQPHVVGDKRMDDSVYRWYNFLRRKTVYDSLKKYDTLERRTGPCCWGIMDDGTCRNPLGNKSRREYNTVPFSAKDYIRNLDQSAKESFAAEKLSKRADKLNRKQRSKAVDLDRRN